MHTIFATRADGGQTWSNSMFENDLAKPVNATKLYHSGEGGMMYQRKMLEVPRYLGQDSDVSETPLYRYLNNEDKS